MGSFRSLKHRSLKHRMADLGAAVSAAGATAAGEGIQLQGGITITRVRDMHLHLNRAHDSACLFASTRKLLRRLESEMLTTS